MENPRRQDSIHQNINLVASPTTIHHHQLRPTPLRPQTSSPNQTPPTFFASPFFLDYRFYTKSTCILSTINPSLSLACSFPIRLSTKSESQEANLPPYHSPAYPKIITQQHFRRPPRRTQPQTPTQRRPQLQPEREREEIR